MEYVWYASYGSNINKERFLCYILGGQARGALTSEEGARDQSMPIKYENIEIPRKQYYANSSKRWQNQGVAFIGSEYSGETTLGRMYLITRQQFEDVVKQECKLSVHKSMDIKIDHARKNGWALVVPNSWYGKILFLGERDGYPIYTFTNPHDLQDYRKPSKEYLQMIASGIYENYHLDLETLSSYFLHKEGIKGNYSLKEIKDFLCFLYKDV